MAEETITIYRVDTGEAVKSVNDLRENVKILKEQLGDLDIGSKEYQDTLEELKVNQAALKDAMYATSSSMEDVAAAATGTAESYNGLVHRMAALKEELRSTDVSTEAGKERFKELASQVNEVNDRLKEMDALQGNYQRNVGNYKSALSGLGDTLKSLPPTLGATKEQAAKVGETLNLIGKQPILGIIGLLAPMIMKITESLKDNETATNAIKKAMAALKPVMDLVSKGLETVAGWVAKAVDWFVSLAGESGESFGRIISGAVGVGKALVDFLLFPIKQNIEAFKGFGKIVKDIFTGDFKSIAKDAKAAGDAISAAFVEGFSFKANFQEGKKIGEEFVKGLGEQKVKQESHDTGVEIGKEIAEGIEEGLKLTEIKEGWEYLSKRKSAAEQEAEALQKAMDESYKEDADDTLEYVEGILAEIDREQEEAEQAMQERMRQRMETMQMVAGMTSSILGSIADMYEANAEESEKHEKKVKALRIAGATIDTISGGISAFMSVWKDPGLSSVKAILAPLQAAAVVAAGVAEIAKIKSTNVSASATASAPAVTSAPRVQLEIPQVRSVTSASEEDRLNQMASDSRVVLVMSDLEVKQNQQRVRVAEATF